MARSQPCQISRLLCIKVINMSAGSCPAFWCTQTQWVYDNWRVCAKPSSRYGLGTHAVPLSSVWVFLNICSNQECSICSRQYVFQRWGTMIGNSWPKKINITWFNVFKYEDCCLGLCHLGMITPRYSLSLGVNLRGSNCISPTIELESWKAIKMKWIT